LHSPEELIISLAEDALAHETDLSTQARIRLQLFNAYLAFAVEEPTAIDKAAEHLLAVYQAKSAPIKNENLLWLTDYLVKKNDADTKNLSILLLEEALQFDGSQFKKMDSLDRMECYYYRLPFQWATLQTLLRKFSIFCHWKEVLLMKELLLQEAIQQHVALIKEEPVDLEAHASLAESYMRLALIYQKPAPKTPDEDVESLFPWISPEYLSEEMQKKWRLAYSRAIEEFSIIDSFAPNDPWVHAQLASIYHELGEAKKESEEYEAILRIVPEDKIVLFKLGVLYFQAGHTAQGLRIYQKLKKARDPQAEHLLDFYDAFQLPE